MNVGQLIDHLSEFDSYCKVKVSVSRSDWIWNEWEERSVEVDYTDWDSMDTCYIKQKQDGTVLLGGVE